MCMRQLKTSEQSRKVYPPNVELVITQSPLGTLDTGDEVTLTCKVSGGNPLAELNWDCGDGIKNNTSGNTSSYSVRFQVNKSNNGKQCNCAATHPVPTYRPTKQHILIVYYPPSLPSLTINPDLPLFEGNSTNLTCHVTDAGNPQSHFTWTWNDTMLHTSMQSILEIGLVAKMIMAQLSLVV
ncbi:unnamed protein product [Mytilus edulis]|uniref:Ig-like domain-containing protein n=1 Tax=Mytilus edulis TaxID=6550 RepID=A0A8S3T4M7_MYTED|nr:unnamed protein product [Mytilus edulis]